MAETFSVFVVASGRLLYSWMMDCRGDRMLVLDFFGLKQRGVFLWNLMDVSGPSSEVNPC